MRDKAKELDQFYTKDSVAEGSLKIGLDVLKKLGYKLDETAFLEPSAGAGAFVRALKKVGAKKVYSFDIDPKHNYIKKLDFLTQDLSKTLPDRSKLVAVGNPPFGKRARLAIGFVNRCLTYADTVIFILPLQFDKFSAQKQILKNAKLVYKAKLDWDSFTFKGDDYEVRCCLQIWTTRNSKFADLRIRSAPHTSHADFEMWQYNNTREAEKYFDKTAYGWHFAVPRQGYKDYSIKESDPSKLDRRTQWIFFKANNKRALANLHKLDFHKLSHKNTSTPGFGKADVVEEYRRMFPDHTGSGSSATTQTFQLGEPSPNLALTLP